MIEVNATLDRIEAMKKSLKIGDKVTYKTPMPKYYGEDTTKGVMAVHKAKIVKKLRHLAVIEYNAKRGSGTVKALATMTYKEIYFQRKGLAW